ncbi:Fic family protein [Algoriphagus zhangzhouensis]|uniref:Fic family protein n=1 Tax=Algoriphagus zhangzhouensis TaxID=1073327 RepID=A0A1M7ZA72_9BACT|nr:Fic family protein [Algoriphagus zhangzhouensis]TDY47228.1 Fic family protein [Algoriphagus zhangzhouensis]SHO61801.1 Fic family protein [Algoriphagus zhangzhouensis]
MYIYQQKNWPNFSWDINQIAFLLTSVRHKQGKLTGRMMSLGFDLQNEAMLQTITQDVLKTSEIEGEHFNTDQVRSSVAQKLGMDIGGSIPADRHVEGVVDMLLDATQHYERHLDDERLFGWHAAMFPTGRSGINKITVGSWRTPETGAMQVVSGAMGKELKHFEAPLSENVPKEMDVFFDWFNSKVQLDPVLKAAIAHLWFVTIHPFDDGNGRIARAITDLQLARSDESKQRFYSMSAQIQNERKKYYEILENTQKGDLEITKWLHWFLSCLERALIHAEESLNSVLNKANYWNFLNTKSLNDRQKQMMNKLLDGFDGKLNTSKWAKITKVSTDTALRDIQNLEDQGVLVKQAGGGRSTSYELVKLS